MKNLSVAMILLLACAAWCMPGFAAGEQDKPVDDIRIIIDVSGSMKHNDPNNLRAPALRLITGLVPKGSRAGVWTFAQYVNNLVPVRTVDNAWREHAAKAADEIRSTGLFTNIEDVLNKATWDWKNTDTRYRRSLIFLTDGFVDVSKDVAANAASRERIINAILPRLRQAGVTVYTVALSGEADHVLLQQVASATDGWYEKAETAENLERIFFRLFEKAARPDALPLKDNTVQVDESIEEMTLLVFRKQEETSPTAIVDPEGVKYSQEKISADIRWHSDARYDLITVEKPRRGTWKIDAEVDPDNRVMVVTNLRMQVTQLPNNLSIDDAYYLFVRLIQQGKAITQKSFLDLVHVQVLQNRDNQENARWEARDDGKEGDESAYDGTYSLKLEKDMNEGKYEFVTRADGKTFQREYHQTVNIWSTPAAVDLAKSPQDGHYAISVIPRSGMIVPESMAVTATLTHDENKKTELTLERAGPAEWHAVLGDIDENKAYSIVVNINGEKPSGKPLASQMGPYSIGKKIEEARPAVTEMPAEVPETSARTEAEPVAQKTEHAPVNWVSVASQVLIANVVVIFVAVFGYKKTKARLMANPGDKLGLAS